MIIQLWIIAICELIRMLQNGIQLFLIKKDTGARDNAYSEFIKSLKASDREYVRRMLEEFEKKEAENEQTTN